jgi:hypothetical protein
MSLRERALARRIWNQIASVALQHNIEPRE